MYRKSARIGSVIALLLGVTTADAGATFWAYERHAIPRGETREVQAHGNLDLIIYNPRPQKPHRVGIACATSGVQAFWNTMENGLGKTKSISFSCSASCGVAIVTPYLPWPSILERGEGKWPLPDKWSKMRLGISCGSTNYGVFEGTIIPHSGDGDNQGAPGIKNPDESDSFLAFKPRSGELSAPNGTVVKVKGYYKFGSPKHEVVTGEL